MVVPSAAVPEAEKFTNGESLSSPQIRLPTKWIRPFSSTWWGRVNLSVPSLLKPWIVTSEFGARPLPLSVPKQRLAGSPGQRTTSEESARFAEFASRALAVATPTASANAAYSTNTTFLLIPRTSVSTESVRAQPPSAQKHD